MSNTWPALPLNSWKDTCATLHMWTQIVGKVRLALTPLVNHWWNVPLYVSARGLTTSSIPYGRGSFELSFDFIDHQLVLHSSDGLVKTLPLTSRTVADFYHDVMQMLRSAGIEVHIWKMPVEIADPIPFDQDTVHGSYDPERAQTFWRILTTVEHIFNEFRSGVMGKSSPVHFFWGSFDLAVTRFSGRPAPPRPGADVITREPYSHEVSSAGFWPGSGDVREPAYYAYAAPQPAGFEGASVRPAEAYFQPQLSEYLLPYDAVRRARSPRDALLDFLQTTYDAGATLGRWDRAA